MGRCIIVYVRGGRVVSMECAGFQLNISQSLPLLFAEVSDLKVPSVWCMQHNLNFGWFDRSWVVVEMWPPSHTRKTRQASSQVQLVELPPSLTCLKRVSHTHHQTSSQQASLGSNTANFNPPIELLRASNYKQISTLSRTISSIHLAAETHVPHTPRQVEL